MLKPDQSLAADAPTAGSRPAVRDSAMPDVASDLRSRHAGTLDRVGMSGIELPVRVQATPGAPQLVPARADAFVSLDDPHAKGIHMSRLFLALQQGCAEAELTPASLREVLRGFVSSHEGMSRDSAVRIAFDYMVLRPALISANTGWRTYPVVIGGDLVDGRPRICLEVTVTYSSTCPCSAALSRQLIQDQFNRDFAGQEVVSAEEIVTWLGDERSIIATPHSQRSYATVQVTVTDEVEDFIALDIIDIIEHALQTPVQAAVKRADEQEFARLNGTNLMFCEDAGRRMRQALEADGRFADYRIEARHVESLHPHDAVSVVVKGVPGGFVP